jgi:hypothetical protein
VVVFLWLIGGMMVLDWEIGITWGLCHAGSTCFTYLHFLNRKAFRDDVAVKVLVYILEQEMQHCGVNTKEVQHSYAVLIEASIASPSHLHTIISSSAKIPSNPTM